MGHRIVLTGGGTGGHVYPALAVAEKLKADEEVEAILYIGVRGHLEERLAAERKIDFVGLDVTGLPRNLSLSLLVWPFQILAAFGQAWNLVGKFKPTAVLGTGGYAAAPPLAASMALSVPFIVHEPDSYPGKVNKLFAPFAALCSLGMSSAKERLSCDSGKIRFNGNPLRQSFFQKTTRESAAKQFGLNPAMPILLVTGGSQGAQAINEALKLALPKLITHSPPIQILHQVGTKNFDLFLSQLEPNLRGHSRYRIVPYIEDLAIAYAASDLTLCRAGAMTIAELTACHKPAIFVPYPYAAQNHQMQNARYMESQGCAVVIPQDELNEEVLVRVILELVENQNKLKSMQAAAGQIAKPNAASELAIQLKSLGRPNTSRTLKR